MGEERSVLRVGGLAGVLAGGFFVAAFITFASAAPLARVLGSEEALAIFPERSTITAVIFDLFVVAALLFLPFLAALYVSLKEPSRVFARIGLGSGVLGIVVGIFAAQGVILAFNAFGGLYADAAVSDWPAVVATYAVVSTLIQAGNVGSCLFIGFAFVAFGLAMRRSQDFGEGLAWLTAVLGIVIVLFAFLLFAPVSILAIIVFALVVGWKVYSLSKTA